MWLCVCICLFACIYIRRQSLSSFAHSLYKWNKWKWNSQTGQKTDLGCHTSFLKVIPHEGATQDALMLWQPVLGPAIKALHRFGFYHFIKQLCRVSVLLFEQSFSATLSQGLCVQGFMHIRGWDFHSWFKIINMSNILCHFVCLACSLGYMSIIESDK